MHLQIREDGLVLVDRFYQLGHMLVFVVSIHQEACNYKEGKRERVNVTLVNDAMGRAAETSDHLCSC
jgi:hypothetical protein